MARGFCFRHYLSPARPWAPCFTPSRLPQYATTNHFFCEVPDPLPATADPARFAEGRVMQHLHQLATVIGHRQVREGR